VNLKGIIYRITLLVSDFLVDLCKCECDRMNGSSLVISQLLLFCLSDPTLYAEHTTTYLDLCGTIVFIVCGIDQHFSI
jgi:hypothetical protein